MAANTGEKAQETGAFRCEKCQEELHLTQGDTIPMCPRCGNDTFDARYRESGMNAT